MSILEGLREGHEIDEFVFHDTGRTAAPDDDDDDDGGTGGSDDWDPDSPLPFKADTGPEEWALDVDAVDGGYFVIIDMPEIDMIA